MMKKLTSLLLSAALMISLLACGAFAAKTKSGVRIAGLKGPTTMGLVNLLDMERSGKASQHYDLQLYGAADEIVPKLIKGELDMAAIPANLAATLYQKTNGGIQVMAVNTLGVLYVVEKGDSVHSFADLKGRTILSTGKGTTPEYVLRYLLTKNGLDPDKDVKIEYYSEASEVTAQMTASKKDAIAVLPQPYVTAAQLKDSSLRVVLDLTKEWNKVCDTQLITGVTVVRTEYAKENPDIVANFLRDYEKSIKPSASISSSIFRLWASASCVVSLRSSAFCLRSISSSFFCCSSRAAFISGRPGFSGCVFCVSKRSFPPGPNTPFIKFSQSSVYAICLPPSCVFSQYSVLCPLLQEKS